MSTDSTDIQRARNEDGAEVSSLQILKGPTCLANKRDLVLQAEP